MSLAAFNAETASGEGAHGPDRSRLAKWYHCSTNRQKRQSRCRNRICGSDYRNRSGHWLSARDVSVLAPSPELLRRIDAY
jgi:hypothetical protein